MLIARFAVEAPKMIGAAVFDLSARSITFCTTAITTSSA